MCVHEHVIGCGDCLLPRVGLDEALLDYFFHSCQVVLPNQKGKMMFVPESTAEDLK